MSTVFWFLGAVLRHARRFRSFEESCFKTKHLEGTLAPLMAKNHPQEPKTAGICRKTDENESISQIGIYIVLYIILYPYNFCDRNANETDLILFFRVGVCKSRSVECLSQGCCMLWERRKESWKYFLFLLSVCKVLLFRCSQRLQKVY